MATASELKPILAALVRSAGWEVVMDALSRVAWDEVARPYGDKLAERIDDALAVVETAEGAADRLT